MHPITAADFCAKSFHTVVFAGGGNRCWWQAGFVEGLKECSAWEPRLLVGASAGAAIAVASVTGRLRQSLEVAVERFARTPANVEWGQLLRGKRPFVLPRIYPEWIKSFLDAADFDVLRRSPIEVRAAITRPIPLLPISLSTALALALYSTEKFWLRTTHARLPHWFGLRSEQLPVGQCQNVEEASTLLLASGAAVPITPTYRVAGRVALDGGFYDSIPLPKQVTATGDSLVLLTRHQPHRPPLFEEGGRVYVQPQRPVAVVNMDCTNPQGVRATFEQGLREAQALMGWAR
jgi:predicted acylesterase/phospholipase RssA